MIAVTRACCNYSASQLLQLLSQPAAATTQPASCCNYSASQLLQLLSQPAAATTQPASCCNYSASQLLRLLSQPAAATNEGCNNPVTHGCGKQSVHRAQIGQHRARHALWQKGALISCVGVMRLVNQLCLSHKI
jgi:hypothetical protein